MRKLFQANVVQSIIFNFRMLPWRQAIRMPILLYEKCDVSQTTGKIVFNQASGKLHLGDFSVGQSLYSPITSNNTTIIIIHGVLELGHRVKIRNGGTLHVASNAICTFKSHVSFGENANIVCYKRMIVGPYVSFSWQCQLFDTDFHYLIDSDGTIRDRNKEISIGEHCWIGNRSTIAKGAVINHETIVASNSLVNKDFSSVSNCILAGIPAKVVKQGVKRNFDNELEWQLEEFFRVNSQATHFQLDI